MAGEKKFGSAVYGFRKEDVNAYIERIIKEFDLRLKEKDEEILELKASNRYYREKYEGVEAKAKNLSDEKDKIASALIEAQENAKRIVAEAKERAVTEKQELDNMLEEEREKIVDIKVGIKDLKDSIAVVLRKFDEDSEKVLKTIDASYGSFAD